ncbi:MAG TPA: hypothetical protein VHB48_08275 [Chitinophagaceae bacterium]|nr:hypothetical protein [Chitinophagaceae bacterium]
MNNAVGIQIKRIKALSFFINESLARFDVPYKIEFSHSVSVNDELSLLFFTLRVFYYYPDKEGKANDLLLDLHVQNVFQVHDFKNYLQEDITKIALPPDVWITIVGLSMSHTRAILAQLTSGTILQDGIFPIMNVPDVAAKFFPDSFKGQFAELRPS